MDRASSRDGVLPQPGAKVAEVHLEPRRAWLHRKGELARTAREGRPAGPAQAEASDHLESFDSRTHVPLQLFVPLLLL